jgi:hypothetical protein
MSRAALVREAERIWSHEHVRIEWSRPGHTVEHPDAPLRVLVISRPELDSQAQRGWPVAELVPEARPRAIAFAWISGAERVVDEAARSDVIDARAPRDYRLGLVLGRAVAHEIGHFLLATGTHAERGLMRASVDAREFAGLGGETFRLDPDASQWLRRRLNASQPIGELRSESFSYTRAPRVSGGLVSGGALPRRAGVADPRADRNLEAEASAELHHTGTANRVRDLSEIGRRTTDDVVW